MGRLALKKPEDPISAPSFNLDASIDKDHYSAPEVVGDCRSHGSLQEGQKYNDLGCVISHPAAEGNGIRQEKVEGECNPSRLSTLNSYPGRIMARKVETQLGSKEDV